MKKKYCLFKLLLVSLLLGSSVTIAGQTMPGNDTQKLLWFVVNKL